MGDDKTRLDIKKKLLLLIIRDISGRDLTLIVRIHAIGRFNFTWAKRPLCSDLMSEHPIAPYIRCSQYVPHTNKANFMKQENSDAIKSAIRLGGLQTA